MDDLINKYNRISRKTDIEIAQDQFTNKMSKNIFDSLGLKEYGENVYINTIYNLVRSMNYKSLTKDDLMFILDTATKEVSKENRELVEKILEETPYDKSLYNPKEK